MVHSYFIMIHQPVSRMLGSYIFWWQMFFNKNFHIASHGAPISCFFWIYFRFLQTFLLINSISFCSDCWIFYHPLHINWLICFWVSWSHFSVLFWMLRMLVTMNKWCHVPHASRITTLGKIFTKIPFGLPKEWVRSWSHAFLITNAKLLAKKLLTVSPKILRR